MGDGLVLADAQPPLGLRYKPANAKCQYRGYGAGRKHPTPAERSEHQIVERGSEERKPDRHLHDLNRARSMFIWPALRNQCSASCPLSADAEAGDRLQYGELLPRLCETAPAGEHGINDHRDHHRQRAADAIGYNAENNATDAPAK